MKNQNYVLYIEYDGTAYAGWQIQPDNKTIQGEIEKALAILFRKEIKIIGAGRTDAGVHALNQVAHFSCPDSIKQKQIQKRLNSLIPDDIVIKNIEKAADGFHARFNAKIRTYEYVISRKKSAIKRLYTWYVHYNLDIDRMLNTIPVFLGEKNFKSLSKRYPEEINYQCHITSMNLTYNEEEIIITISANRFLHSMVRIIVGILVETGKGTFTPEDVKRIIEEKNFKYNKYMAPAKGLFLKSIIY